MFWSKRSKRRTRWLWLESTERPFRSGLGIFSQDTLDAEASLHAHHTEAEDMRLEEQRVAALADRWRRAERWKWLPWSAYKRAVLRGDRWINEARARNVQRANDRAAAYKHIAMNDLTMSHDDIHRIDHGIPATDRAALKATDPSEEDDDIGFDPGNHIFSAGQEDT